MEAYTSKRPPYLSKKPRRTKLWWAAGIGLLCLTAVAAILKFTDAFNFSNNRIPVTAGQETKGEPTDTITGPQPQTQGNAGSQTDFSSNQGKDNSSETSANLIAPLGDFVSAHHVAINSRITSVCNTSSGATCKIVFTQGDITISLQPETTDRGGSAYWNEWAPKSIGLKPGTWQIKAVATLNGQTKATSDAMPLEISQ